MRTAKEFNEHFTDHLHPGANGLQIEYPSVVHYLNEIFKDLVKIEGFQFSLISTHMGLAYVHSNIEEILPFVGRIMTQELQEKINFILKVEFEVERRLESLK